MWDPWIEGQLYTHTHLHLSVCLSACGDTSQLTELTSVPQHRGKRKPRNRSQVVRAKPVIPSRIQTSRELQVSNLIITKKAVKATKPTEVKAVIAFYVKKATQVLSTLRNPNLESPIWLCNY